MTVILISRTAKELAGAFYEQERTPMFRRAYPTAQDYIYGRAHYRDGRVGPVRNPVTGAPEPPPWTQFVQAAREQLVKMLSDNTVSDHLKARIHEQLVEHAIRGSKAGARRVVQTNLERRDEQPKEQTAIAHVRV